MVLYMEVTQDKYELPVAVACTVRELAELRNTTENNIRSTIYRARAQGKKCKYIKVEVE